MIKSIGSHLKIIEIFLCTAKWNLKVLHLKKLVIITLYRSVQFGYNYYKVNCSNCVAIYMWFDT